MTKHEAVIQLNAVLAGDSEMAHKEADEILLNLLTYKGFDEVVGAYEKAAIRCDFWRP